MVPGRFRDPMVPGWLSDLVHRVFTAGAGSPINVKK